MNQALDLGVAELAAAANCLRLIGHPNRLAIVLYLLKGPCLVSELESELNLHQPNLSQHLSILRDANILSSQRQAKAVLYELKAGESRDIIAAIHGQLRQEGTPPTVTTRVVTAPLRRGGEIDEASVFAQVLPPSRG